MRITLKIMIGLGLCWLICAAAQPVDKSYYKSANDIVYATVDNGDPSASIYRFVVLLHSDTDTAVVFIPIPANTPHVGLEWSAYNSTYDSVYVLLKYGTIFTVGQNDSPVYYSILQDSSLYWYKAVRQYSVQAPEDLLNSRCFVVYTRGAMAGKSSGGTTLTLKIIIPK